MHPKLGEVQYVHTAFYIAKTTDRYILRTVLFFFFSLLSFECTPRPPPSRSPPSPLPSPPPSSSIIAGSARGRRPTGFFLPFFPPSLVGISSALRATASYDDCLSSNEKPQGQQEEEEFASSQRNNISESSSPAPGGSSIPTASAAAAAAAAHLAIV